MIQYFYEKMLPEPDLFASVKAKDQNPANNCDAANHTGTTDTAMVLGHPVHTAPAQGQAGLTQLGVRDSDRREHLQHNINHMCQPYSLGTGHIVSKDHHFHRKASVKSLDFQERRTRRWYLTVIVLLYVGLITSFCLNVSLLLKSYPEEVISLSPQGFGLDEAQLFEGN